ncbi:hypothetical protein KY289_015480 [Solanum tuberosum]|nr:hypothetical protein KY289_015480 [Solanum tuberosum]
MPETAIPRRLGFYVGKAPREMFPRRQTPCFRSQGVSNFFEFPEIGLGDHDTDIPFMTLCKEGYFVLSNPKVKAVSTNKLAKPIIFHNGRFIKKPTPLMSLFIIIWIHFGFLLAFLRISIGILLPIPLQYYAFWATGIRLIINGTPPLRIKKSEGQLGVLFVCCHNRILDNIFLSAPLDHRIQSLHTLRLNDSHFDPTN